MAVQLTEIELRNFKPFGDIAQRAPMSKITLIYGPNSGGKSSIIQALLLLKQSDEDYRRTASLTPQGEYVDLGGYATMVHKHELDREMELNVKFSENTMAGMADEQASTMEIGMTFRPDAVRQTFPVLYRINYRMHSEDWQPLDINLRRTVSEADENPDVSRGSHGEIVFEWDADVETLEDFVRNVCKIVAKQKREQDENHQSHALMRLRNLQLEFFRDRTDSEPADPVSIVEAVKRLMVSNNWSFMPNVPHSLMNSSFDQDELSKFTAPQKDVSTIDILTYLNSRQCLDAFASQFKDWGANMSYLGPVLDDPRRYYYGAGGTRSTVGKRGEHTFDIVSDDASTRQLVNQWFERFEIPYTLIGSADVAVAGDLTGAIDAMLLVDDRTGTRVTPADVGFGISQILPVIVEAVGGTSDTICVDQPEVHLHPRLQAEVADLMIETRDVKRWIVETHSELLARRIQTRIAQGKVTPGEISILYVQPAESGSTIRPLRLAADGEWLDEWPGGFFAESTNELIDMLRGEGSAHQV